MLLTACGIGLVIVAAVQGSDFARSFMIQIGVGLGLFVALETQASAALREARNRERETLARLRANRLELPLDLSFGELSFETWAEDQQRLWLADWVVTSRLD